MKAYRTYLTVTDANTVIIPDVPFAIGERVEVLMLVREKEQARSIEQLGKLLSTTQAIAHVKSLSDEDIAAEIEAYRNDQ